MPPSPPVRGSARSAAQLNALIRAFWPHRDKRLSEAERAEYAELVTEWIDAEAAERGGRVEIVEAA